MQSKGSNFSNGIPVCLFDLNYKIHLGGMSQTIFQSEIPQALTKALPKLMWFITMESVLGYSMKHYYKIGRQALKRTTTCDFLAKSPTFSAIIFVHVQAVQ